MSADAETDTPPSDAVPGGRLLEQPKRNLLATLVAASSRRRGLVSVTPHTSEGTPADDKIDFEYEQGSIFWSWFGDQAGMDVLAGRDVLDAGCGWGGKTVYYAEVGGVRSIAGFDLPGFDAEAPARWARERGLTNCTFANGTAEQMPYADNSFDVVMLDDVLEHVEDPRAALAECARVLRPGGRVYARFPSIKMMYAHHFDRITMLPALHRVMSMKHWAAGFNHYIERTGISVAPFSKVETRFGREVCRDLSGMDVSDFEQLAAQSPLSTIRLELEPVPSWKTHAVRRYVVYPLYNAARQIPPLRETLSFSISYIGELPAVSPADD